MTRLLSIFLCAWLWCTGGTEIPPVSPAVVTEIRISNFQEDSQRSFTREKKICQILTVLRLLQQEGIPCQAPKCQQEIQIRLSKSDGTSRSYFLRNGMYLSTDGTHWKQLEEQRAVLLEMLLIQLPED